MEIPAFYVQNAKIYPGDTNYYVQVVSFVLPYKIKVGDKYVEKTVKTFDENGDLQEQTISELF